MHCYSIFGRIYEKLRFFNALPYSKSLSATESGLFEINLLESRFNLSFLISFRFSAGLYLSMGKQAERLQTIWVSNTKRVEAQALTVDIAFQAANEVATAQRDELSFKKMIQFNQPHLFHWFSTQAIHWQDQSIFLVDPKGNIALRFRPDLSGKEMISDIKWLFKASRLG